MPDSSMVFLIVFYGKTKKNPLPFFFCSDHIFAGHNEDRGSSWVVILGGLSKGGYLRVV